RMSLKRLADRFLAEDLRQGTYIVAMQLVLGGKGPKPGFERGWMCRVRQHRERERGEPRRLHTALRAATLVAHRSLTLAVLVPLARHRVASVPTPAGAIDRAPCSSSPAAPSASAGPA
ncbi:MAG TPA: hypothetical protein VGL57_00005, partial [Solirubrobacteraceae bacterium]